MNNFQQETFYLNIQNGNVEICVEMLDLAFQNGIELNRLMTNVVRCHNVEMVDFVVNSILDNINENDELGMTLIHHICHNGGHIDIMNRLITSGINVDVKDNDGRCGIHFACNKGNLRLCERLIESGCNINVIDNFGLHPIHLVIQRHAGNLDLLNLLVNNRRCDVNVEDKNGRNILEYAIQGATLHDNDGDTDGGFIETFVNILANSHQKQSFKIQVKSVVSRLTWDFSMDEWMTMGTIGVLKRRLIGPSMPSSTFLVSNSNTTLQSHMLISRHFNFTYWLLDNISTFTLGNHIRNGQYNCYLFRIDDLIIYIYNAWKLADNPINEVRKLINHQMQYVVQVTDIRSDGTHSFVLTREMDVEYLDTYKYRINSLMVCRQLLRNILYGMMELIQLEIRLYIDDYGIQILDNNQCKIAPFLCKRSSTTQFSKIPLDQFYLAQFDSILKSMRGVSGSFFNPINGPHQSLLEDLSDYLESRLSGNMKLETILETNELLLSCTVEFSNIFPKTCPLSSILIVTYFCGTLTVRKLKMSVASYIAAHIEDIFIVIDNKIYSSDRDIIKIQPMRAVQYFVVKEHEFILPNILSETEYFNGFNDSTYITRGSFSWIYCHRPSWPSNDRLAIKFFPNAINENTMSRNLGKSMLSFINEMNNIRHPNIVEYYHFNRVRQQNLMIVMEYMEGNSLNDYIKTKMKLCEAEVKYYLRQILVGLHHLHVNRIIHLDIRCDNILLNGDRSICKLSDFGSSCRLPCDNDVVERSVESTSAFVSPEVLDGSNSVKADIWSLGGAIVEMATGVPPFPGQSDWEIKDRIRNHKRLDYDVTDLSPDIVLLIDMCTRTPPEDRPSALDLLNHDLLT